MTLTVLGLISAAHARGSARISPENIPLFLAMLGVVAFIIVTIAVMNRSTCPACGARGTLSWRHATMSGGQDNRYSDNAQSCSATGCGWASDAVEREHEDRERAEQEREQKDTTVQALMYLFKYMATGDGKYTHAEKKVAVDFIETLLPGRWRPGRVAIWLDMIKVDGGPISFRLNGHDEYELRKKIYAALVELTTADGTATAGEKKRLKEVQLVLGVNSKGQVV